MQKSETCKDCKWLEQIPFFGYSCQCEESDYFQCECNPKADRCDKYKSSNSYKLTIDNKTE